MNKKRFIRKTLIILCGAATGSGVFLGTPDCRAGFKFPGGIGRHPIPIPIGDIFKMIKEQQEKDRQRILSATVAEQQVAELVKRAGDELATRLPKIDGVKDADQQKILAITSIQKAGNAKGDVEGALATLQTSLINNEAVAGSFVVVDRSSSDVETIMQTVSGAAENSKELADLDDPLQRKASTTKKVVYHPDDIYVLSGKLFIQDNGDAVKDNPEKRVITYQLTTRVIHARSGQVRMQRDFRQAFTWNKDAKKFVPAA